MGTGGGNGANCTAQASRSERRIQNRVGQPPTTSSREQGPADGTVET